VGSSATTVYLIFFYGSTAPFRVLRPPHFEVSRSHFLDTPHSVGLLWTRDQLVAEISQHSQETDIHALGGIRTHNPSKRAAADPRLRPYGNWDRHTESLPAFIVQVENVWSYTSALYSRQCLLNTWTVLNIFIVCRL
jgi:hypothetical protein